MDWLSAAPTANRPAQSVLFPGPLLMLTVKEDPGAAVVAPDAPLTTIAAGFSGPHAAMTFRTLRRPPDTVLPVRLGWLSTPASSRDLSAAVFSRQTDNISAAAPETFFFIIQLPPR